MKKNLRLACLFFLIVFLFTAGFVYPGSANEDSYNYSFNETNFTGKWDNISSPTSEYKIWGYPSKEYNFTTTYNSSRFSNNSIMVFYWDCNDNKSNYTPVPMNNLSHHRAFNERENISNCTHTWDTPDTYYLSVGVFENGTPVNVSYWVPIEIRNNTLIKVETFYMLDENEGFNRINTTYNVSKSTYPSESKEYYCGYVKNDYSFNVTINDTFVNTSKLTDEVNRTIKETTTEIYWGDTNSDNSLSVDNSFNISIGNNNELYAVISAETFTHGWNGRGEMEISANGFFWDPLDGERYPPNKSYNNTSILIIPDPKNLVSYPLIGNLQNWGILLSILGLVIFYFTYTRNNVPIKIPLIVWKPFYLKSVNSLIGTLIFVAGMYLWFVFGRCPWDIPIVSSLDWLSNIYFNMLYHEYETKQYSVPYLSILIGLLDIIILSLIIHLIAIPLYKGQLKFEKL